MKVVLQTKGPVRAWHRYLEVSLAAAGHQLALQHLSTRAGLPVGFAPVLASERRYYGATRDLFRSIDKASMPSETRGDLVLAPYFDGVPGERALCAALLARRVPRVEIREIGGRQRILAAGLPSVEARHVLLRALDDVLGRTQTLVAEAVGAALMDRKLSVLSKPLRAGAASVAPSVFFGRTLAADMVRRLKPTHRRHPNWRVAWRVMREANAEDAGAGLAREWRGSVFQSLDHDGQRFQADPFILTHEGRTCVFFEDFPFATGKGVIAMVEIDKAGQPSRTQTVLDLPFHLSYPHVFVVDGCAYMLPEMSAAGRVQLFRADPFPDRWVEDRVLLDGVKANDATLIKHGEMWWLFATLSEHDSSSWDALGLFHAPHPFGPWTPHRGNPVLIDAGAARPAGEMWHESGVLMRVAQDCRAGYGGGLTICRVERLDTEAYVQSIVTHLGAPPRHGDGIHTLNRTDTFEAIDVKGPIG